MHLFFLKIGCFFFTLFEKNRLENAPKFGTFGCFFKNINKKNNNKISSDRLKYLEIPLEDNTSIFFSFSLSFLP